MARRSTWSLAWVVGMALWACAACSRPPDDAKRLYRYVDGSGQVQFAQGIDNVPEAARAGAARVDDGTSTNSDLARALHDAAMRGPAAAPAVASAPGCGPKPEVARSWRDRLPRTGPMIALWIGALLAAVVLAWRLVRWVGGAAWLRAGVAIGPLVVCVGALWLFAGSAQRAGATDPRCAGGIVDAHRAIDAYRIRAVEDALHRADGTATGSGSAAPRPAPR